MNINNLEERLKTQSGNKKIKSKAINTMVCKYWLENDSCKKGQNCEFLHEFIESKIPECTYQIGGICTKKDCKFKHSKREKPECVNYRYGFCKDGINCKMDHSKKELCLNYILGFCPEGPNCKLFHLKSLISKDQDNIRHLTKQN